MTDAYEEGYDAYMNGLGENPYDPETQSQEAEDWEDGWAEAELDQEQKESEDE